MANRHAGRLGDVWKHLALADLLAATRPARYAETHAGNATYPPASTPEHGYGIATFAQLARSDGVLAASRYATHLRALTGAATWPPGSPAIAMAELGARSTYLLCDVDPGSTADLARWAAARGLAERVTTATADGMRTVAAHVLDAPADPSTAFVHVDPYDPDAREPGGLSALELTRALIDAGAAVMYWYGFDEPGRRAWALDALADGARPGLWCGDVMVTTPAGAVRADGHLGTATTPGTGAGIVCANVGDGALARCGRLGRALAGAYRGRPLPSGEPGALDFTVVRS